MTVNTIGGDLNNQSLEPEVECVSEDADALIRSTPQRGRFRNNLLSNAALFGFNVLVGLWFTPYLIHHLGTAAYGIIPLAAQITNYMIVFTATLNSAVGRYLTIALEKNEDEEANQYFNTSLFGSVLMVLLLIPLAVWAIVNLGSIIDLPEGQESQARWLFVCTVAGFFLGTLQSPFGVSTFCRNRFDLKNAIAFVQAVVRVGLVVVLFSITMPQIWQVGVATLVAMFFGWGWSIRLWRKLTPTLCISLSHFSRKALASLFSTGGWIAVNNIGMILFLSIDLLLINRMFGPVAGGRYATVLQWSVLLRTVAGVIGGLFTPTLLCFFAKGDIQGLAEYSRRAVRLMAIVMSLFIGGICGFAHPLLMIWLGKDFGDLDKLMILLTGHLAVNLAVLPLFGIQIATNRVTVPGIMMLLCGLVNLLLAIYLAGFAGWGMYGVAAASAIVLSAKNFVFTPLYNAHIIGQPWSIFFRDTFLAVILTIVVAAACIGISRLVPITSWMRLLVAGGAVAAVYTPFVFFLIITREEKSMILARLPWGKRS